MIAQYRPDIARVAEDTVLNLKELENRIEILKNDLAVLCTNIGHPEAARIAATPARWLGAGYGAVPTTLGPLGQVTPFAGVSPAMVPSVPPVTGVPTVSPFGTPFASPFASPFVTSGFAQPGFGAPFGSHLQAYPGLLGFR